MPQHLKRKGSTGKIKRPTTPTGGKKKKKLAYG
jgi:hypothetical protein